MLQEQFVTRSRAEVWLTEHYGDALDEAFHNVFFHDMSESDIEVSDEQLKVVHSCFNDWLLSNAVLQLDAGRVRCSELLPGPGSPRFTAAGRRYIEEMAASEMSIYEVLEVRENKGLLLRDMLLPDEEPVFVVEKEATQVLVPWDTLGARLLCGNDDTCTPCGTVCWFSREKAAALVDSIHKAIRHEVRKQPPRMTSQEIISNNVIAAWLNSIYAPRTVTTFVDAETQEPTMFTTDIYRVSDWEALQAAFAAYEEIEQEDENLWFWLEPIDDDSSRTRAKLMRLADGRLQVECRTVGRADEAAQMLKRLAGSLLSRTERTTQDPGELLQENGSSFGEPPQQEDQDILLQIKKKHCTEWLSMPIPALNGKTPLQAVRLKAYRPRVVELLKGIERLEARNIQEMGAPGLDVSFLWERLGLTRE